jgi:hypothetical protein
MWYSWIKIQLSDRIQIIIILIGGITLIWSIFISLKTIKYTHDSDTANDGMRKKELQAYLGITEIRFLDSLFIYDRPLTLLIHYKNFGKTPSYNISHSGGVIIINTSESIPKVDTIHKNIGNSFLASDQTFAIHFNIMPIDKNIYNGIISGKITFYYVIGIFYYDVFGKKHFTQNYFRFVITRKKPWMYSFEYVPENSCAY